MELKKMNIEELELLSYTDLADMILKEKKKPMNTPKLFKTICDLLKYSDDEYSDKIGEFYTSMTTDKRFVFLDSAEWDLKDNHSIPLIIDDLEDEEDIDVDETDEESVEEEENVQDDEELDNIDMDDDIDDLEDEEDMDDLSIVDDEEEEIDEDEEES